MLLKPSSYVKFIVFVRTYCFLLIIPSVYNGYFSFLFTQKHVDLAELAELQKSSTAVYIEGCLYSCLISLSAVSFFLKWLLLRHAGLSDLQNCLYFALILSSVVVTISHMALCVLMIRVYHVDLIGIGEALNKALNTYPEDRKQLVDRVQIKYHCCGVNDYRDWLQISWYEKTKNLNNSRGAVPFSCCSKYDIGPCIHEGIGETFFISYKYEPENLGLWKQGCLSRFERVYLNGLYTLAIKGLIFGCFYLLGAVFDRIVQSGDSTALQDDRFYCWVFGTKPASKRKLDNDVTNRNMYQFEEESDKPS